MLNKETGEEADSLFGCVYAFNTLGFTYAAISLAADLAESLLSSDAIDANRLSVAVKSAYICRVLKDAAEFRHIAFNLGLLGLAMPRKPASTKMQEVRYTCYAVINTTCWGLCNMLIKSRKVPSVVAR